MFYWVSDIRVVIMIKKKNDSLHFRALFRASDHFNLLSNHCNLYNNHFSLASDHFSLACDCFSLMSDYFRFTFHHFI